MARKHTYFAPGPLGTMSGRTCTAHDYRNSHGDEAVILHRNGKYEVHSAFYKCKGFNSLRAAAKELIDRSPVGRCDWEEVDDFLPRPHGDAAPGAA